MREKSRFIGPQNLFILFLRLLVVNLSMVTMLANSGICGWNAKRGSMILIQILNR